MAQVSKAENSGQWILGVTGGIAAYKAPELVRLLKKGLGFDVRVVMSKGAQEFVTPTTLQAVSSNPVYQHIFDNDFEAAMGHIALAKWAGNILIAPLSANRLAALAHGFADDLLTTLCLASKAKLWLAPAMNQQMWANKQVQANLEKLKILNPVILGPDFGEQACGDTGLGRMLNPSDIVNSIQQHQNNPLITAKETTWQNHSIVITAGPTREYLDPVRFLSNRSSGKMGFALAEAARDLGAHVTVVSGPVHIDMPQGVHVVPVETAEQMHQAVMSVERPDVFIGCAAVADFCFEEIYDHKIKKQSNESHFPIMLKKNIDILSAVAHQPDKPFCVGFAAETQDFEVNARKKLAEKKVDMIALNDVSDKSIGFDSDENQLRVLTEKSTFEIGKNTKYQVAVQLLKLIRESYDTKNSA